MLVDKVGTSGKRSQSRVLPQNEDHGYIEVQVVSSGYLCINTPGTKIFPNQQPSPVPSLL